MKRFLVLVAVGATFAAPAVASAGTPTYSDPSMYTAPCSNGAQAVRPSALLIWNCLPFKYHLGSDANLTHIHWATYRHSVATGRGRFLGRWCMVKNSGLASSRTAVVPPRPSPVGRSLEPCFTARTLPDGRVSDICDCQGTSETELPASARPRAGGSRVPDGHARPGDGGKAPGEADRRRPRSNPNPFPRRPAKEDRETGRRGLGRPRTLERRQRPGVVRSTRHQPHPGSAGSRSRVSDRAPRGGRLPGRFCPAASLGASRRTRSWSGRTCGSPRPLP